MKAEVLLPKQLLLSVVPNDIKKTSDKRKLYFFPAFDVHIQVF